MGSVVHKTIKAVVKLRHINHNFLNEMIMWLLFRATNPINKSEKIGNTSKEQLRSAGFLVIWLGR